MGYDRRKFLKAASLAALTAVGTPLKVLAQDDTSMADTLAAGQDLPQATPKLANRWAMVIDLKKCADHDNIKGSVEACHKVHNVPGFDNPKDEIKWIWEEDFEHAFHEMESEHLQEQFEHIPVLLLCNHCDNPPCTRVCPTEATWKRKSDGIVMMDWHRCIGCRYCVAACPYGSRSFNWRDPRPHIKEIQPDFPTRMRGVVEKCTFCEERLAQGKMPACVEAAKNEALVFGDLEDPDSRVRQLLKERFFIRRKVGLGTQPEVYYLV